MTVVLQEWSSLLHIDICTSVFILLKCRIALLECGEQSVEEQRDTCTSLGFNFWLQITHIAFELTDVVS